MKTGHRKIKWVLRRRRAFFKQSKARCSVTRAVWKLPLDKAIEGLVQEKLRKVNVAVNPRTGVPIEYHPHPQNPAKVVTSLRRHEPVVE